jgi:hypothetical protein
LKNAVCFPPQHLALAMLSDESCTLEVKVEALFEQYRKMAVGKTAAELVLVNSKTPNKKFTDIKSKYKLIVLDPAGVLNAQRKSHY